jgi:hypothetical protein
MIHEVLFQQYGRNLQEKLCLNIVVDNSCGHKESCQQHEPQQQQQQQPNDMIGAIPALCWMKTSYHPASSNRGKLNSNRRRHSIKRNRHRPNLPSCIPRRRRWNDSSDGSLSGPHDFLNVLPRASCYDAKRTSERALSKNNERNHIKSIDSPPRQPSRLHVRRSSVTMISLNSILDQALSLGSA